MGDGSWLMAQGRPAGAQGAAAGAGGLEDYALQVLKTEREGTHTLLWDVPCVLIFRLQKLRGKWLCLR